MPAMNPVLMEQLAARLAGGSQDPLVGALVTSMMEGQGGEEDQDDERERREQTAVARMKASIRRLRADLRAANEMLRIISDVFGACELCWGEDPSCPRCRGKGQPGSAFPVREDVLRWVEPALNRLGLTIARLPESPETLAGHFHSREEKTTHVR
jgi:hypothetical protein